MENDAPADNGEGRSLSLNAGDCLFREGEPASHVFIIESGQIELEQTIGDETHQLALFEPGELVGELALLEGGEWPATARAKTAATLLCLDAHTLSQVVQQRPEIGLLMVRRVSRRLWQLLDRRPLVAPAGTVAGTKAAPKIVARLVVTATGKELPLPADGEAMVGRADPQAQVRPEIELSAYDSQRSLSRRHARIVREGGAIYVCEEPEVLNGTFVNGERLAAGERRPVKDGDEIRFGLVKTTLRTS